MPKLICPQNQIVELTPNQDQVEVKIRKPKTDLNFKRDVTVRPSWVRNEKIILGLRTLNITYTARHPISQLTATCTFTIFVIGEN